MFSGTCYAEDNHRKESSGVMSLEYCPLALFSSDLLNVKKKDRGQSPRRLLSTKGFSQQKCWKPPADKKSWGYFQSDLEMWSLLGNNDAAYTRRVSSDQSLWLHCVARMLLTHTEGPSDAGNLFNCLTCFHASQGIQVILSNGRILFFFF